MLHELPHGEVRVYLVDLSGLPPDTAADLEKLLNDTAFICNRLGNRPAYKLFWNFAEPLEETLNCPSALVRPWAT